jgi:hypothetical protein
MFFLLSFVVSFTKLENKRVEEVLPGGKAGSGGGWGEEKVAH